MTIFSWKSLLEDIRHSNGYNCAPLLADIFLYSYEAECSQLERHSSSVQSHRYIDDVLSTNNPGLETYLGQMYPVALIYKFSNVCHFDYTAVAFTGKVERS